MSETEQIEWNIITKNKNCPHKCYPMYHSNSNWEKKYCHLKKGNLECSAETCPLRLFVEVEKK